MFELIDDEKNDIFVHMDLKNKHYDEKRVEKLVKKSKIYHIERKEVSCGSYNMVDVELRLFRCALSKNNYR